MRRVLAIGSAALLAFTVTVTPAPAADLGMPTKAPLYKAPVVAEEDYLPLLVAFLIAAGIGACIALCEQHHEEHRPATTGGNTPGALPSS
jgi:hypothetical protein